jgi:outer membrane protein assembly factor BamB
LVAGVVCALSIAFLHQPALASATATLSLSVMVGPPTTLTVASGAGFAPNERVALGFDSRVLEEIQAAPDGTFATELKIPASTRPGDHTVRATGRSSGSKAAATFTVRTNWPTPRFVPEGTGFNPYENVLSPSTVGDLELAWSKPTKGAIRMPLVVDGVVYVAGQVDSTATAEIYAFDATTGERLWTRTDLGEPISDYAVADGKIFASFLTAHTLRAYDAATGDLLWNVHGPTQSPTVVDGVIYAADDLRSLWAIDAESGHKRWVAHAPLGGYGFGVAVADGMVYAGGSDVDHTAPVYAYDVKTGALVWKTKTNGQVNGTPAVAYGRVYVGSGDHLLYALDAKTGRIQWTAPTGSVIAMPAVVANGTVYVGSADHDVYAFDAKTGDQLWVSPTGGTVHAPVVANGVVYVGSNDDIAYAFDAASGDLLWSYPAAGSNQTVVDGTLYVSSADHLYAFRVPGG